MVSSPKSPNPYQQASADQKAQGTAAAQSAVLNNPNEVSPYGSVNYQIAGWEQTPGADGKLQYTPRYTRTTSLSPDEQRIADYDTGTRYNLGRTATQQSAKIGSYLNESIDQSQWQPWMLGAGPGAVRQDQGPTDRKAIEDAMMASYHRQADPQNRAAQTQLANRGLSPGSQGYGTYQQGQQDAQSEAARQSYLASGGESREAQNAYNQATQLKYELGANYADRANQLRQAQEQSSYAARNQPINEIMALLGGSQVNMPQFSPFSRQGISAASPGGYMQSNYANQVGANAATNQGLFGLGGAGLNALGTGLGKAGSFAALLGPAALVSDRRLKVAITPTPERLAGVPVYTFTYRDHPAVPPELRGVTTAGVMADEVRPLHPDAVLVAANGYDLVDYGKLFVRH